MAISSIGETGTLAESAGGTASLNAPGAMIAQAAYAQVANVEALFGSLGLGTNINAVA